MVSIEAPGLVGNLQGRTEEVRKMRGMKYMREVRVSPKSIALFNTGSDQDEELQTSEDASRPEFKGGKTC